ncbi:MAG: hypothetical protein P8P83_02100, partial [Rickettsiaceae bacterium]|nr:hypothetical protein [Rickettsiaceae bacterium]
MLKKNAPTSDGMIALLGIFIIVLTFITAVSLPKALQLEHNILITSSYISTLFFTASLISYPVWSPSWKGTTFIAVCWNATILYVLAGFAFFMVLFTGFGETQVIIYMTNILLIVSLINWRWALVLIVSGMLIVASLYKLYLPDHLLSDGMALEFKMLYLMFIVCGVVIAFLKPKQEYIEDLETEVTHLDHEVSGLNHKVTNLNEQVGHFHEKISEKDKEIDRLGSTAQRILNNVNHELRLP